MQLDFAKKINKYHSKEPQHAGAIKYCSRRGKPYDTKTKDN